MKIVLANTYDVYGGAARAAYRLFCGFRQVGADCVMLAGHKMSADPDVLTLKGVTPAEAERARGLEADINAEMAAYPALAAGGGDGYHTERAAVGEIVARQMPAADVVNLHWVRGFIDYAAFFASRPPGQPVVWTLHDMGAFTGGCHYARGCERFVEACGACPWLGSDDPGDLSARVLQRKIAAIGGSPGRLHVVAPSRWLADEARRSRLFRNVPVSVIPYGLETDVFHPGDRAAARAQFNLPADLRIILFVAHVVTDPRKGLHLLEEALRRLGPQPGLALLTVGKGKHVGDAPVQRLHADLVSDNAVMQRLYSAADLVVVPSLEDNLPNTVLEAMACGVPVAGFSIGGIPDMIRPGETGFLAAPGDTQDLADQLGAAFSDMPRLAAMGRNARAVVEREHTLEVQARRYLDLFAGLVASAQCEQGQL